MLNCGVFRFSCFGLLVRMSIIFAPLLFLLLSRQSSMVVCLPCHLCTSPKGNLGEQIGFMKRSGVVLIGFRVRVIGGLRVRVSVMQ